MKIKPEHLEFLRQALAKHDTDFHRSRYVAAELSDKRYRWDLMRHAVGMAWVCGTLYPYLNDDHIDTALRRLVKPLERIAS
jgi:O-methyltransferase involved in polyketide biosynthesis